MSWNTALQLNKINNEIANIENYVGLTYSLIPTNGAIITNTNQTFISTLDTQTAYTSAQRQTSFSLTCQPSIGSNVAFGFSQNVNTSFPNFSFNATKNMDYGLICDYLTGEPEPVLPIIFFVKDGVFINTTSYQSYNTNYRPTFTITYNSGTLTFYVNNTIITPLTQTGLSLGAVSAVFGNIVSIPVSIDNIKFTGSAPNGNFPQPLQNLQDVLEVGNDGGQLSINNVDDININSISNAVENNGVSIKLDGVDYFNVEKTTSSINDLIINGDLTLTQNTNLPNPNITSNTITLNTNEYNSTMYNGHVQFNNNLDGSNWVIKDIGADVGYFKQSDLVFTYTDSSNNAKRPLNLSADGSVQLGDLSSTLQPQVFVSGLVGSTVQNGLVYDTYFNKPPTTEPQNIEDVLQAGNDANQESINNVNKVYLNTLGNAVENNGISIVLDGSEFCNINKSTSSINDLIINGDLTLTQNTNLPNPNITSNIVTLNTIEYGNTMYNGHVQFNNTVDGSNWVIKDIGKNIGYFKQSDLVFTYTDSLGNPQRVFNLGADGSVQLGDVSSTNAPKVYVSGLVGQYVQNGLVYDTYFNKPPVAEPQSINDVLQTGNRAEGLSMQLDEINVNLITNYTPGDGIEINLDGTQYAKFDKTGSSINKLTVNGNLIIPQDTHNVNPTIAFNNTVDSSKWDIQNIGESSGLLTNGDLSILHTNTSGNTFRNLNIGIDGSVEIGNVKLNDETATIEPYVYVSGMANGQKLNGRVYDTVFNPVPNLNPSSSAYIQNISLSNMVISELIPYQSKFLFEIPFSVIGLNSFELSLSNFDITVNTASGEPPANNFTYIWISNSTDNFNPNTPSAKYNYISFDAVQNPSFTSNQPVILYFNNFVSSGNPQNMYLNIQCSGVDNTFSISSTSLTGIINTYMSNIESITPILNN